MKLVTLFTGFIRNLKKTFLVLKFISACAKPKWSRDKTICKWCYKKLHNLPNGLKHVYLSCHKNNLKDRCRNKSWKAFPEPRKTFQYDKCAPLYCCLPLHSADWGAFFDFGQRFAAWFSQSLSISIMLLLVEIDRKMFYSEYEILFDVRLFSLKILQTRKNGSVGDIQLWLFFIGVPLLSAYFHKLFLRL